MRVRINPQTGVYECIDNITPKKKESEAKDIQKAEQPFNNGKWKKPTAGETFGGIVAGYVAGNIVAANVSGLANLLALSKVNTINKDLTSGAIANYEKATEKILEKTGLDKVGYKIIQISEENKDEVKKILLKETKSSSAGKMLPNSLHEMIASVISDNIYRGKNAVSLPNQKAIILPIKNKRPIFVFHEIGHAINTTKPISNLLRKMRPLSFLSLPIGLIAIIKSKKPDGEKPKGVFDKTTTFIKNHVGTFVFVSFLPMLLEEGMATLRGNKIAKEMVPLHLAKKVAKTNALCYLTYLGTACGASLGYFAGNKLRDNIAHPKKISEQENVSLVQNPRSY